MVCLQQAGNLIWWDFAKDCFIFHHAYNARSDKKIAYQCKWKGKACGGGIANTMCFQGFFTLRPSLQWLGLGVPGLLLLREPSWTGCQVGCSFLATYMFDTLMMFVHIVCWTQSERGKPGNLDHLHSLWLHCRAPWLAGGLLRHRVNRSKIIFTLTIFERVSSLVWVVLWFLLVADSPDTVGGQILVFFLLRSQIFSTGIYLLTRRNTSWSPLERW